MKIKYINIILYVNNVNIILIHDTSITFEIII